MWWCGGGTKVQYMVHLVRFGEVHRTFSFLWLRKAAEFVQGLLNSRWPMSSIFRL
jgi:hypothetical protein